MERKSYKRFRILAIFIIVLLASSTMYLGLVVAGYATFNNMTLIGQDKYKELLEKESKYNKLEMIQKYVEDSFYLDTSEIDFEEGMIDGIFSALNDPYSVYFNPKEFKDFMDYNTGTYGGLGITIAPSESGEINVVAPFEDTPAHRAGIKPNDKIIKVEGVEYMAKDMDKAVEKMKGEPGTSVTITIKREGEAPFDVTLVREMIVIKSVKSHVLEDNKDIGYLRISAFDDKVYEEFQNNLESLKKENIKGLIIDIRNNPGGSLDQVIKIADKLLGEQTIVSTKNRSGRESVYTSDKEKIDLPFVVLINGSSASASEILTGAVKDTDSGKIIGTTTYGKGLVQSVLPMFNGGGMKVTIAQYFTPNGSYINKVGIKPDVEVELSEDYDPEDESTDNQLEKAIEILKEEIK